MRKKGIPFAEARIGTWRGPDVLAYGRTLRRAFSGGSTAKGSFTVGSDGGFSRRGCGGVLAIPRGSVEIRAFRVSRLFDFDVVHASR